MENMMYGVCVGCETFVRGVGRDGSLYCPVCGREFYQPKTVDA